MTDKEREIEEAYKELEHIWAAEREAKSMELEAQDEQMDTFLEKYPQDFNEDEIVDVDELEEEEYPIRRNSNPKIAIAIIANKCTGRHSTGSWHKTVATIIGDFFYINEAEVTLNDDVMTIKLTQPQHAYYLNDDFDCIVIEKVDHLSYKNLPRAKIFFGNRMVRVYEPYDFFTEYYAYEYKPKDVLDTINEVRQFGLDKVILTTDGGLYEDTQGYDVERLISNLNVLHGLI